MSIEEDLQEYVSKQLVLDPTDGVVGVDQPLMSSGRIDSMGLLKIVSFVQEKYMVDILETGEPEDFETISGLAAAIRRNPNARGT